jgi:hypothetical protein
MSARVARTADGALREMLAAMNMRQMAQAASATGVSTATLRAYSDGRSTLPAHSMARLVHHCYSGKYFEKVTP